MAFVQIKPSALLIREEGLNTKSFLIPITSLLYRLNIGDKIERIFISFIPPENSMHRAISTMSKKDMRQAHWRISWGEENISIGELSLSLREHIALASAAYILPAISINGIQELVLAIV